MSRRAAGVVLVALLASLAHASEDRAPACEVEVALEPARAFVGQQVLYRASVWLREDVGSFEWSRALAFPNVRSEMLPGDPRGERRERAGARYRRHDERRALFAERSGSLRLAAPELLCHSGASVHALAVPEVVLEVEALPPGAPEGFSGLVGPVLLHQTVTPRALPLGGSARIALMLRSPGNLWVLPSPFGTQLGGAELFERRPELVLERGHTLTLRRHFAADLVPREPGPLRLPEIAIAWLDPETRSYRFTRAPPVTIDVGPRAAAPAGASTREPPFALPEGVRSGSSVPAITGIVAALAALLAAAGALVIARRRRRPSDEVRAALAVARAAPDPRSAAPALARALRAALAAKLADARTLDAEEALARGGLAPAVREALGQLAVVERARFDPRAPAPDPEAVARAVAAL